MAFFRKVFKSKSEFALKLERILGFTPKQIALYQQAFLHKSIIKDFQKEAFESNERLEFLGDSILDSIVSNYLFKKFPLKDEGYLTKLRSRIVSRQTLNNLGYKIGLKEFVKAKLEKESKTIYGDALEAMIGAIYIDRGFAYAEQFVIDKLIKTHLDIDEIIDTETDFKSRVLEWAQKNKKELKFTIEEIEEETNKFFIATLLIDGSVKGKGNANSKKNAEQLASEQFYNEIQS